MILYNGKAKDINYKVLVIAYIKATKPLAKVETVDFSRN